MKKTVAWVLMAAGLFLLLYPAAACRCSAMGQQEAIQSFLSGEEALWGYLAVPALELSLPLRTGTTEDILRSGAGVLEGTESTSHPVLCGHRGLPQARLFRDLDRLGIGDVFSVTREGETRHYRVERVEVVSPEETGALLPEEGLQLCTLLTCTPLGINSHRLLIRGRQIPEMPS